MREDRELLMVDITEHVLFLSGQVKGGIGWGLMKKSWSKNSMTNAFRWTDKTSC